jgi:lipoprotein-releasing system permease protein
LNVAYYLSRKIQFGGNTINALVMRRIAVGTVALSVLVMLVSFAVMHGFRNEVTSIVRHFNADMVVQRLTYNNILENEPVENFYARQSEIQKIPGVIKSYPVIIKPGIINTGSEIEGVVLRGINQEFDSNFFKPFLLSGSYMHFEKGAATKDILISKYFAGRLNLKPGDKLPVYFIKDTVRAKQFVICGIYESGMEELDNKYAICDIRHLQKVNQWSDSTAGSIFIQCAAGADVSKIRDALNNSLGAEYIAYTLPDLYPQLYDWLSLVDTNAVIISVLMLVVSCISMITVLLIVILDKTQAIGTLKSLGMNNRKVVWMFWYKAAIITSRGLLWGNLIAFLIAFLQIRFHIITLPKQDYYVSTVPMQFDSIEVLLINAGTLVVCMICMLLPVQLISRINTVKVLRFK